jgi:hypothetical protein
MVRAIARAAIPAMDVLRRDFNIGTAPRFEIDGVARTGLTV